MLSNLALFNRSTSALSPFDSLARWSRDLDRVFDHVLAPTGHSPMRVDVRQDGHDLVFQAEVPGLKKEDVDITVENGVLTISGGRDGGQEREQNGYHIRERWSGKVTRSFTLPETADTDRIDAHLADGLLTLRIPTREEAKPRQIEVK